jgi:hypothetical protein
MPFCFAWCKTGRCGPRRSTRGKDLPPYERRRALKSIGVVMSEPNSDSLRRQVEEQYRLWLG